LETKLIAFKTYYNEYRGHAALKGETPIATPQSKSVSFKSYRWRQTLSWALPNTNGGVSTNSP
jgi:hypothetical protein